MQRRPGRPRTWVSCGVLLALLIGPGVAVASAPDPLVEAGRRIYQEGLLPSGEPLKGIRFGGMESTGREVACVLCHQRSGMGLTEGAVPVPPVNAPVLFRNEQPLTLGRTPLLAPRMRLQDYHFRTRPAYDDATLARAIRDGVSPSGYVFNPLMPRYPLSEAAMQALLAYLHQLSDQPSPGIVGQTAHLATVIAPGMDPARRKTFLDVLHACVDERHGDLTGEAPPGYQTWRLHVWDLAGPPEGWGQQLAARYAEQPVFALLSGLGSDEWAPVETFCEANAIPCLFPNVEVPGTPGAGRYSFYFFKGVLLEAEVVARYLAGQRERLGIGRVVQLTRWRGSGARAAATLRSALQGSGMPVEERILGEVAPGTAGDLLGGLTASDALVLWLDEPDLAALTALTAAATPPPAAMILASAVLGGQDKAPLTGPWRTTALLVYPFDPPYRWERRMTYNLRPWLDAQGLPRADERLQGNTLAACHLLSEGMLRLRGRYLRDYLVEWTENYPTAMGNAPAPQAFPRFSLGPGQRFSSKGAYIARFAPSDPNRLERVEDWIVP